MYQGLNYHPVIHQVVQTILNNQNRKIKTWRQTNIIHNQAMINNKLEKYNVTSNHRLAKMKNQKISIQRPLKKFMKWETKLDRKIKMLKRDLWSYQNNP